MDWQVALALSIAEKAHEGQFDKAGKPYMEHPIAVAGMVSKDKEKVVAYLHDVLEDTNMTMDDLKGYGFDDDILWALAVLTRSPGMDYNHYIASIRSSDSCLAVEVKKADLRHNMDLTRLGKVTLRDLERQQKYLDAYVTLMGGPRIDITEEKT